MKTKAKVFFLISGITATLWFLIRVIPKPSRAAYPCMQASFPLMSGFVLWLLSISAGAFSFRKTWLSLRSGRWLAAGLFLLSTMVFLVLSQLPVREKVYADSLSLLPANKVAGQAKGILPGRVVWIWNPSSTNEKCTNVYGDGWFMDKNTNMAVVDSMVRRALTELTGSSTTSQAWERLFRYHNQSKGRGNLSWSPGEKIFIKVNCVSASDGTFWRDYSILNTKRYGMSETSPQTVLAILRQLVNDCGIPQECISVGDPLKHLYKHVFEYWSGEFPRINYIDHQGSYGRTKAVTDNVQVIFYSDRGKVLVTGTDTVKSDALYTVIREADYLINIGALKAHARAGVSLCAKNHFGSHTRSSAAHLHPGLMSPDKNSLRTGYGLYRVQVDLMGHKDLGGKTMLYMVDGLWGGSEANDPPRKWSMPPFNNDWSSSVFVSQDPVAIESVGYDFLKAEYTASNPYGSWPQIPGTDDYMLQAADPAYWPPGISYDPENDGSALKSLGVCEHWNNTADKQYSRNLKSGEGIELVFVGQKQLPTSIHGTPDLMAAEIRLFPNPAETNLTIEIKGKLTAPVEYSVFDARCRLVKSGIFVHSNECIDLRGWSPGVYFVKAGNGMNTAMFIKK